MPSTILIDETRESDSRPAPWSTGSSSPSRDRARPATATRPRSRRPGCVVTPGLVNAHHHLLQTAFRTLPGTRGVPMSEWLPTMAAAYAGVGIDPELARAAAPVGVAEGLLAGVTTVADHHLNWPAGVATTVGIARATAAAAAELGGRLVFVRGSARDDPEQAAASADAIVDRAAWPDAAGGVSTDGMLQFAVGPAGVHSDSERDLPAARRGGRAARAAPPHPGQRAGRRRDRPREVRPPTDRPARRVGLARGGRHDRPPLRRDTRRDRTARRRRRHGDARARLRPADGLGHRARRRPARRRHPGRASARAAAAATTPGTCSPTRGWPCRSRRSSARRSPRATVLGMATEGSARGLGRAELGPPAPRARRRPLRLGRLGGRRRRGRRPGRRPALGESRAVGRSTSSWAGAWSCATTSSSTTTSESSASRLSAVLATRTA